MEWSGGEGGGEREGGREVVRGGGNVGCTGIERAGSDSDGEGREIVWRGGGGDGGDKRIKGSQKKNPPPLSLSLSLPLSPSLSGS